MIPALEVSLGLFVLTMSDAEAVLLGRQAEKFGKKRDGGVE